MKKYLLSTTLIALLLILMTGKAFAQAYTFNIPTETVDVFWNEDGSASLDYVIVFNNDPGAHAIDFVDLGLPNSSFDDSSITADANGVQVSDISRSGFQGSGPGVTAGVAVGLGSQTISPGSQGKVHVHVGKIDNMLQPDSQRGQASAVFSPAWFTTAHGETNLTVVFHFPKGVEEKDASYHATQPGWADQPVGYVDDQGLVTFTWNNPKAGMSQKIDFGASFPSTHLPATAAPLAAATSSSPDISGIIFIVVLGIAGVLLIIGAILMTRASKYEAPKISVEGYGIKRGLTAVQAAVLLKVSIDKILTMILFSVVKKGAAQVISSDPLEVKVTDPIPAGLEHYEFQFLQAFKKHPKKSLRESIESMMIELFRDVDVSMGGFNRKETVNYYKKIVQDAWAQVEIADTPEIASQKLEDNLDWTMLDNEYTQRTQRVFMNKPVFLPRWWSHYDPTFLRSPGEPHPTSLAAAPSRSTAGVRRGVNIAMPVLPGADFAATIALSTQDFSTKVAGNLTTFSQKVIAKSAAHIAPPPPQHSYHKDSTSSFLDGFFSGGSGSHPAHSFHPRPSGGGGHSGGGGSHCACACAGGGR